MCNLFGLCYAGVNPLFCLYTDGREKPRSEAQSECISLTKLNTFLPRVTNSVIQSKLGDFRSDARMGNYSFWIDVNATAVSNFHWIDGSSLAGHFIYEFAGNVLF